jgi:ceramide glucosyltransferase
MIVSVLLTLLGVALFTDVVVSHFRLKRSISSRRQPVESPSTYPSVTVVRPIRGRDVDAELNFTAALDTGYPGPVETLFVLDDVSDPAYPVATAVVEAHQKSGRPGTARVLVAGSPPAGRTGKLNAMILGLSCASGELVAFGDSDTRPDQDVLRIAVDTLLSSPGAGSAFVPVVAQGDFKAAGDAGYAMMINSWYGPSVAANAEATGDLPFIMGQLMVLRREAIKAMGGLEDAEGQLVDDMYMGARIAQVGYRNVVAPTTLRIAMGGMSLLGFIPVLRRWMIFSKSGLPGAFVRPMWRRGIQYFLAVIGTGIALATAQPLVALFPAIALITYGLSMLGLYRAFAGEYPPFRYAFVAWMVPIVGTAAFISSFAYKKVEWRGRSYALDTAGELASRGVTIQPAGASSADATSGLSSMPAVGSRLG